MRFQSASADIKSTGISLGIRLPNGLTPSFSWPMASVSHLARCAVVALCKAWISNSRQKSAKAKRRPHCSRPRSNPRESMQLCIDAMVIKVELLPAGRLQRVREVICARPRSPKSVDVDICKSSTNLQEANVGI
jgi:hypothetical protein